MGRDGGDGERAPLCPRSPTLPGEAGVSLLPRLTPGFGCHMPLTGRCIASERAQGGKFASLSSPTQKSSAYWTGIPLCCIASEHRTGVLPGCRHPVNAKAGLGEPGKAFLCREVVREVHGACLA